MPYKSLLVHADAGPGCNRRVYTALTIADWFEAAVTGLGAEAFDPLLFAGGAELDGAAAAMGLWQVSEDIQAAEAHFRRLAAGRREIAWIGREDCPDTMLALHARGADLIVASRPEHGESAAFAARPADLVMRAGAPVLFTADGEAELRAERIVVAWKDAREARRAVSDALPLLARARKTTVVAVDGDEPDVGRGLAEVAARLARHGVAVETEVARKTRASIAETLEAVADRHGADLIVAGAYGHSRVREWALGGVTEDLIAASSKFVLLSH
jgi:nucleotide-binding universal stress UspA family protein